MPTGEIISAQYDWDVELSGGETHYHAFWTDDALNPRAQMACCRRNLWKKQNKKTQLYDLFLLKAQRATVDYFAPTWRRIGPRCIVNGKHPRPSSWTEGGARGALKTKNKNVKQGRLRHPRASSSTRCLKTSVALRSQTGKECRGEQNKKTN